MHVQGGQTMPIDFKTYMSVTISKGILLRRPDPSKPVIITIKYVPLANPNQPMTSETSETLAKFEPGSDEVKIESFYFDTQNPKIIVPEGAEIKFEGNFTSSEEFAENDDEEEDQSSTQTPEDEEDDEFQDEESEA